MKKTDQQIVTFKADATLLEVMKGIPNRSQFIRGAILAALENLCPLCRGTGTLTPDQMRHWNQFVSDHPVEECDQCHEFHLVCANESGQDRAGQKKRAHR